jgi:hypothetical protein
MKSIRQWLAENNMDNMDNFNSLSFRNVMGGPNMEVNTKLKQALRPKIEALVKEHEGEDVISLLREIIAASLAVLGDFKGTKIPISKVVELAQSLEQNSAPVEEPNKGTNVA